MCGWKQALGKGVSESHFMDRLLGFILFLALHGVRNMGKRLVTRPQGHFLGETTTVVKRVLLLAPNYLAANNRNSCKAIVFLTPMLAASSSSGKRISAAQRAHSHRIILLRQNRKE